MKILGIDPGLSGGFALISDEEISVFHTPNNKDGDYDRRAIADWFHQNYFNIHHVFVEMAAMRPGNSAQSGFVVGRGFGMLEGLLNAFHLDYTIVYSQTWSKRFQHGVTEQDKDKRYKMIKEARANIAKKLFPEISFKKSSRCSKMHDGMVDAALIALYGLEVTKNNRG